MFNLFFCMQLFTVFNSNIHILYILYTYLCIDVCVLIYMAHINICIYIWAFATVFMMSERGPGQSGCIFSTDLKWLHACRGCFWGGGWDEWRCPNTGATFAYFLVRHCAFRSPTAVQMLFLFFYLTFIYQHSNAIMCQILQFFRLHALAAFFLVFTFLIIKWETA